MEETPLSYIQIADIVMKMGKRSGAAFINAECMAGPPYLHLDSLLDIILDPNAKIDDTQTIDWCKWLIAGGRTPTEFASIGECLIVVCRFKSQFNFRLRLIVSIFSSRLR